MENDLNRADAFLIDEAFPEALEAYNEALTSMPTLRRTILTHRAAARLHTRDFLGAAQDCNEALELSGENNGSAMLYYRKGQAYFELDEFETSLQALQTGLKLAQSVNATQSLQPFQRLIRKCEAEIKMDDEERKKREDAHNRWEVNFQAKIKKRKRVDKLIRELKEQTGIRAVME